MRLIDLFRESLSPVGRIGRIMDYHKLKYDKDNNDAKKLDYLKALELVEITKKKEFFFFFQIDYYFLISLSFYYDLRIHAVKCFSSHVHLVLPIQTCWEPLPVPLPQGSLETGTKRRWRINLQDWQKSYIILYIQYILICDIVTKNVKSTHFNLYLIWLVRRCKKK